MGKRVELPEVVCVLNGDLEPHLMVRLEGITARELSRDEGYEAERRCNHYPELVKALDNAIKAWDVFYPDIKPQDAAEDAEFGPLLQARTVLAKAKGE